MSETTMNDLHRTSDTATTSMLLNVKEVAEILAIATRTVWYYTAKGLLPKPIKVGRHTRWKSQDIDDYIESQKPVP